jgi:hypothetical protein
MAAARRLHDSAADELEQQASDSVAPASRDDLLDVPATVVCAVCGNADCLGCVEERSRSGVISIIAWERPGSTLQRLWSTAKASTMTSEAFFETLPEGPIGPALRFAVVSELVAAGVMLAVVGGALLLTFALLLGGLPFEHSSSWLMCRVAFASTFGLALLLVASHAAHGLALDVGARRSGAPANTLRALRFGLYAAGWDLVLGPVGMAVLLVREGPAKAFSLGRVAMGLPTRAALAFLRGTYRLEGAQARPALLASYVAAVVATLLCAALVLAALGAAIVH